MNGVKSEEGVVLDGPLSALRHNVRLDRVCYIPIDQLHGYKRKLRKHLDASIQALMSSVSGFGIVLPILIDQHNTIIGGEGIVAAAKLLGYTEVPTIRVDHLDEAEVRLLRIALNKLSQKAEWNEVELAAEFGELLQMDVELAYEVTGFDTIEIDNLLHTPSDEEDPDDAPVDLGLPGTAVSQLGDQWELGDHRIACGSSLDENVLNKLMNGEKARMVLSDGPFNVKINGHVSVGGKQKRREFQQASGELTEAEFIDFQIKSTTALANASVDGALLYLWMDWAHQWEMMSGIRAANLTLKNMAVWVKRSGGMGSFYRSQYELCYIAKKGKNPHRNNIQLGRHGRSRTNCWFYPGVNSFGSDRDELLALHPTSKNVSMFADAIRDATHRGEIVLDGFLGGGASLIAAERTGRICRGVELDPLYVDAIVARWENATGRKAVLQGTGETIEQVAARRAAPDEAVEAPRVPIVARRRVRA